MVERREHSRFTLESRTPHGVIGKALSHYFERRLAMQPGVGGTVDFAHAARSELAPDAVLPYLPSNFQRTWSVSAGLIGSCGILPSRTLEQFVSLALLSQEGFHFASQFRVT